jgi:outer membrane receptor protein involved in Fe transport
VNGDYFTTNGYRLNSAIDAKNAGGSINYFPSELITLNLSSGYHKDNTGLPGALTETNLETLSRKDSVHPNDYANTEDYYFKATPEINFWGDSLFKVDSSYRKRDVFEFASFTGGDSTGDTRLSTMIVSPQALLKFNLAGQFANRLTFGMDYQHAKEEITNNLNYIGFPPTTGLPTLQKTDYGYYALEEIDPFTNLTLSGGYRYDQAKFEFSPSNPSDVTDYEHAVTAGVNYKFADSSQAYFNYSRSFRYPLLDELYDFQFNTITVLQPQSSNGYELGIRHSLMKMLRASVNLFKIDTDNEIFYDPITFQNTNLPGTAKREGIEVNLNFQAFDWASVYATYTYTHTEIESGQFDGKKIPGVPNHLGTLGTTLQIAKGFTFDVVGYYVGERPFISDFNNAIEEQDDYFLVNTKLRYNWKNLTAYLNVNNVTNRKYSEFGVVTYSGQKAYYPSPETNFLAGIAVDF